MTRQMLIYDSVVPLTAGRHRDCWVEIGVTYGFSGSVNSVPLMAVEFPSAASEYAIVFAGNDAALMPAVILGIRDTENLFVSKESEWDAKYIPAFVRRYPFVFSASADGQRLTLCIDEEFSGFNREGRGQRLFENDGRPTGYVDNVLKFLQEYQAQFVRTQAFCRQLNELDLLEPMQAQVETASGGRLALGGFKAVSRQKLKALPPETLTKLARTDELELLYLHLHSMRNFVNLRDRLAVAEGARQSSEAEKRGAATDQKASSHLNGAHSEEADIEKAPEPAAG